MLLSTEEIKKHNNAGFSIVELIICVSILAIASIPLMKSLGMASKTNAKAQSIQNATSLAESIMEEMKSMSISQIKDKYGEDFDSETGILEIPLDDVPSHNETFDVKILIDKSKYSGIDTPGSDKKENVQSANTIKLPRVDAIDTMSQAVLSSEKELNKYDQAALAYFNEKKAKYPAEKAKIASKTIDIIKKDVGSDHGVTVKATVTYVDDSGNKYVKDIYAGSFVEQMDEGETNQPIDSNIYIFYNKSNFSSSDITASPNEYKEYINIKDEAGYSGISGVAHSSHKVFFVRQDNTVSTGPIFKFDDDDTKTFSYSNLSVLDDNGCKDYGKIMFITNIDKGNLAKDGHIYDTEAKNRVYDITVVLTKSEHPGVEYARLNSTVTASDKK